MRAPEPPVFVTPRGDIEIELSLAVQSTDTVFLSVDGSEFEELLPAESRIVEADADGARTVSATAYAVDAVGNASRYVSSRWKLYPAGYAPKTAASAPPPAFNVIAVAEPSENLSAGLTDLIGSAKLVVRSPEGTVPCVAVNSPDPFGSSASYVDLSGSSTASSVVSYPWGFDTEIVIHYGFVRDGIRHIAREPMRLVPGFPTEDAAGAPSTPVLPAIRLEETAAYIQWPSNPWTIMISVSGTEFQPCLEPVRVELQDPPTAIRYYALDRLGTQSVTKVLELPSRYSPQIPYLDGIRNGGTYGSAVVVLPRTAARLRYEAADGDAPPEPVSAGSAILDEDGLRFEGADGRIVRYRLRVVADSAAPPAGMIAESAIERFYDFSIDREPPPVPQLAQGLRSFSSSDSTVSFKPLDGSILVSISEDGNGPFMRYDGPVAINGSDEGRRRYVIRAYAEDEFGNRSRPMQPVSVLIDKSALYADASGRPSATGLPDDPIPYLDDAMDAAQASGKRFVYVRGVMPLRRTVVVTKRLTVAGGFDADWNESQAHAAISIRIPPSSASFALVTDGGALELSSVNATMTLEGTGGVILARSGSVRLVGSTVAISGGIDATVIKSSGAAVSVESSALRLSSCVTGRGLETTRNRLDLEDSAIYCDSSVRLFDAVRMYDTESTISGLRIEASPSQALSVLHASGSVVRVEGTAISIGGGSSSCRVFGANASDITVSSAYVNASWKGSAEAFSAVNGSRLRIAHASIIVDSPGAAFANVAGSSIEVRNTIASFAGPASVFMRNDMALVSGSVTANCLWGFSSHLEGRTSATTLADFNRIIGSGKANFSEPPSRTFTAPVKGLLRLSKGSSCVDAGIMVDWASPADFMGTIRASGRSGAPDIGAEEL